MGKGPESRDTMPSSASVVAFLEWEFFLTFTPAIVEHPWKTIKKLQMFQGAVLWVAVSLLIQCCKDQTDFF